MQLASRAQVVASGGCRSSAGGRVNRFLGVAWCQMCIHERTMLDSRRIGVAVRYRYRKLTCPCTLR